MAMVSVSWLIAVYYNVIISHVMLYLFASIGSIFTGIPWVSCDNHWNTDRCLEVVYGDDASTANLTANDSVFVTTPSTNDSDASGVETTTISKL